MTQSVIRDLGDGLILRRSTPEDAERLVAFNGDLHREIGAEEPEEYVAAWTRDLMCGEHPSFDPGDFTIVEDTCSGSIVSTLCLIPQTWSYDGIHFGVGRPELVGTHPDYRGRGLIRAQFDVIHRWSEERGLQVQAITGIPYFYRQFGYEMAMTLGGSRLGYKSQVPKLKDGEEEPFRLRPVTEDDLSFIAQVYEHGIQRYPVACVWDEALWRYELLGKSAKNVNRQELRLIETSEGEPVGFIAQSRALWDNRMGLALYELKPGVSWLAVTPAVVRYLWAAGEDEAAQDPEQEMERFAFWLGAEHPAYQVFRKRLPDQFQPYAWYLRVPDLLGFLRHLAPALDRRLAGSLLAGHSGKVKINFYRSGLQLGFEAGRLVAVEPWQPAPGDDGDAGFPDLTFLQLLFGYRSMDELDHAFADCWASPDRARPLLEALFPKRPSDLWPVS
jgi:GNAT superfamily N-acetyltransferase